MAGSMARPAFGGQGKRLSFHGYFPFERTFFPFLQIAYHAEPCGMLRLLEVEGIVVGLDRFETEYFDKRSRFFMEVQTRLNNFGIIENHQAQRAGLVNPSGKVYLEVEFDAPLFGIWSPAKKHAPFVCIEPWYGRSDREDFDHTLEKREWGNELEPGAVFEKSYKILVK